MGKKMGKLSEAMQDASDSYKKKLGERIVRGLGTGEVDDLLAAIRNGESIEGLDGVIDGKK